MISLCVYVISMPLFVSIKLTFNDNCMLNRVGTMCSAVNFPLFRNQEKCHFRLL